MNKLSVNLLLKSVIGALAAAVVVLRYQEGLGLEEIAAVLEMPVSTVKSDLQRALAVLQRRMHKPLRGGEQRPRN